jgi:hypothetical protein
LVFAVAINGRYFDGGEVSANVEKFENEMKEKEKKICFERVRCIQAANESMSINIDGK